MEDSPTSSAQCVLSWAFVREHLAPATRFDDGWFAVCYEICVYVGCFTLTFMTFYPKPSLMSLALKYVQTYFAR